MKRLKIALAVLIMLLSLVIAEPSLADPNYKENPDYIQVTKTLKNLQKEIQSDVPENIQRQISELKFQKAAIKSGMNWGQCRNKTGRNLAIYGNDSEESSNTEIYFLADGQTTPEEWDCQGVYLPSDVQVSGLDKTGAVAIKIIDGTRLVVKKNPETSEFELNLPSFKVVNSDKSDWLIPNVSQAFIDSRIPNQFTGGDNG
jgi:hypothetical protein